MGFKRTLVLSLAIQIFGFIKYKAMLHKKWTEQNDIQKGKNWMVFTLNWMCD